VVPAVVGWRVGRRRWVTGGVTFSSGFDPEDWQ